MNHLSVSFQNELNAFACQIFLLFEINAWPLLPKNFTILNQKLNPVEKWKVRYVG